MKHALPRLSALLPGLPALILLLAPAAAAVPRQSGGPDRLPILGVEYPLERWTPADLEARLQANLREREHLPNTGDVRRLDDHASRADAAEYLGSAELRELLRLQLEECALQGLRAAHTSRDRLRQRATQWEAELERLQRDRVDLPQRERLRMGLDKLRPQVALAGKILLAGCIGQPPLGETACTSAVGIDFSGNYAPIAGLLKWPSVIGQLRLGDPAKPEYRQRLLVHHAQSTAATYSRRMESARSEQQEYFRASMEFAKRIAELAQTGDYRGIDRAREDWIEATLGGLLEPSTSVAVAAPAPAEIFALAPRTPVQDYKDGLADVIDLDTLSLAFLEGRRAEAERRLGELRAIPTPEVEHVREARKLLAHQQLAQGLKFKLQERERERSMLTTLQQRLRSQAELGLAPRPSEVDEEKRLERKFAAGQKAVFARTCTRALKDELLRDSTHFVALDSRLSAQLGLVDARVGDLGLLCFPIHMGTKSGGRWMGPVGGWALQLEQQATRLFELPDEPYRRIGKWLAEEAKFYTQLADDLADLEQRMRGNKEYRELATRIDRELRTRREALLAGFFDPLPSGAPAR